MINWPIVLAFVSAFLGAMILLRVLALLWIWSVMAAGAVIDAVTAGIAGLTRQVSGIAMRPVRAGFTATWTPIQGGLDRLSKPEAPKGPEGGYAEAVAVLGLPEKFDQIDVIRRRKDLISAIDPDSNGTHWLAARVNDAKVVIFKRNGWT